MNGRKALWLVALSAAAAASLALGDKAADEGIKAAFRGVGGEMREMVEFLKPDEAQQERILAVLKKHAADRKALATTAAEKREEIARRRRAVEAEMKPLLEKLAPLQKQLEALRDRERDLARDERDLRTVQQAELATLFTPEQRFRWQTYKLFDAAWRRVRAAGLSDDQKARIRELAEKATMKINQLDLADREKARAVRRIEDELNNQVYADVLTDENRLAWQANRMVRDVEQHLRLPRLDDEQRRKVRQMCLPHVTRLRDLSGRRLRAAWQKAVEEIAAAVAATVLTDEQKKRLKAR
jgi:hypothetical protein